MTRPTSATSSLPVLLTTADLVVSGLRPSLVKHPAIVLDDADVTNPEVLLRLAARLGVRPRQEYEAFAARQVLAPGVYGPLPWPATDPMCTHHAGSYLNRSADVVLVACLEAPDSGGETGLVDTTLMLDRLAPDLVAGFDDGWRLDRTYSDLLGTPLEKSFGSSDRDAIERYCDQAEVSYSWDADGTLHTSQLRKAIHHHPDTGARCWFNEIAFLNRSTLDETIREYLEQMLGVQNLPYDTHHADGHDVEADVVEQINAAYQSLLQLVDWKAGRVLLLDNRRVGHSRQPYQGRRKLMVLQGNWS